MNRIILSCPCCGLDAAESDEHGRFYDEQPLICGCPGWVCIDDENVEVWISDGTGDGPCPACEEREQAKKAGQP